MENVTFRPCGDCTACCDGQLISESHGNMFGKGKPCIFLVEQKCTVYETRPATCRKYQCAWTQVIIDESLKPNKCGLMVSVENGDKEQFLRAIEIQEDVSYETYQKFIQDADKLKAKWIRVRYNNEQNIYNQWRCGSGSCSGSCS